MGDMLRTLILTYNEQEKPHHKLSTVPGETHIKAPCKVAGFLDKSYGKFGTSNVDHQIIMEYNEMFPYLADYLPHK